MRCPFCGNDLRLSTIPKRYETLMEHVVDPNMIHPLRYPYVCSCTPVVFWDGMGGGYGTRHAALDSYSKFQETRATLSAKIERFLFWKDNTYGGALVLSWRIARMLLGNFSGQIYPEPMANKEVNEELNNPNLAC